VRRLDAALAPRQLRRSGYVALAKAGGAAGHEGVPSLLRLGAPSAGGAPGSIIRRGTGAIKGKIGGRRQGRSVPVHSSARRPAGSGLCRQGPGLAARRGGARVDFPACAQYPAVSRMAQPRACAGGCGCRGRMHGPLGEGAG